MDLFDLVAKISLDSSEYENGLEEASDKTSKWSEGFGKAAKAVGAGLVAAGTAAVAIGRSAIEAYADYEQLVGGVETLFGDSADVVQEYAANAFRTAGLSANQYMETVTSFSASLLQSLGGDTEEAARIGDMAITDMADNANKMGTSMEAIQNAYQGFAKQNYTMLDNLKLGYGGTKEEMERLLADATALSGVEYDIGNLSDVYAAIHVIQTELGITGTTAAEASETISGSLASMKSAWSNLLVGVADDQADFDTLVGNFADSVGTVAENLLPRIGVALKGVGKLIEGLAPVVSEALPQLISDVLPTLMESAASLLSSFGMAILQNLPLILKTGLQVLTTFLQGISSNIKTIIPTIVAVVLQIVETLTSPDSITELINGAIELIIGLAIGFVEAIPQIIESIPVIIENVITALIAATPLLISAGVQLFMALVKNLPAIISGIVRAVGQILDSIFDALGDGLGQMMDAGRNLLIGLWNGIASGAGWLWNQISGWLNDLWGGILGFFGIHSPSTEMAWVGEMLVAGLSNSISANGDEAVDAAEQMSEDVLSAMSKLSDNEFGADMSINRNVADSFSGMGSSSNGVGNSAINGGGIFGNDGVINIVVQSILDGRVIGETAYKYSRNMARSMA